MFKTKIRHTYCLVCKTKDLYVSIRKSEFFYVFHTTMSKYNTTMSKEMSDDGIETVWYNHTIEI
jgi:hypothetical protein